MKHTSFLTSVKCPSADICALGGQRRPVQSVDGPAPPGQGGVARALRIPDLGLGLRQLPGTIIDADALNELPSLRDLSIHADIVPNGILANLENPRRFTVSGLGPTVEVANLKVACAIGRSAEPILLVDDEVVVVQESESDNDVRTCQVIVGQQQLEIVVEDLWPGYWR